MKKRAKENDGHFRTNIIVDQKEYRAMRGYLLNKGWTFSEWVRAQMKRFIKSEKL